MQLRTTLVLSVSLLSVGYGQQRRTEAPENYGRLPHGTGWYDGREVRYRVIDGLAIVEGDIVLGTVEELQSGLKDRTREAVGLTSQASRWPNKTVIYQIDAAIPNQARITDAIAHWEANTSIRFKQRTNEAGFVSIRRASSGCVSTVGYTGSTSSLSLADSCSTGSTIHEFGHTLGLFHTQARSDRNLNIRVLYENLDKFYWDQFDQLQTTATDFGPYDYGSIMHYPAFGDGHNYRATMATLPTGIPIGQRAGASSGDIQAIERMYGTEISGVTIATVPAGLPVIVDGAPITAPQNFAWKAGEQHTIEVEMQRTTDNPSSQMRFSKWSDGGAAQHTITVEANKTLYIASYSNFYRFQAGRTAGGTLAVSPAYPDDGFYPEGSLIRLLASPNDGMKFFSWVGGPGGGTYLNANGQGNAANPVELSLHGDAAPTNDAYYVAQFVPAATLVTTINSSTSEPVVVTVDGAAAFTPRNVSWGSATTHTLSMAQTQFVGPVGTSQRIQFQDWSNGGSRSQTVTATGQSSTITANVKQQFEVTWDYTFTRSTATPAPPTLNNIRVSQTASDDFFDAGTELEFSAEGPTGVPFANWSGDLGGSAAKQTLVVNDQKAVLANFLSEPFFNAFGFVNSASLLPTPAVPGTNMLLYRPNIGPDDDVTLARGEDGKFPTTTNGVAVAFGSTRAEITTLSKNSISLIVPADAAGVSTVNVTVTKTGSQSFNRVFAAGVASPGIYTTDPYNGFGQAYSVNDDSSFNTRDNPATRNTYIVFVATGLGKFNDDGSPVAPISVEVGGVPAYDVVVTPTDIPGDYGIAAVVDPSTPTGPAVPLAVLVGGARSQQNVTIAVR